MRDINVVVLVGRLTRDSEIKYTKSGMPIARFSLAVNRSVKKGDAWEDEASFLDVDFWGKAAEAVNRYLVKGAQVGVEGELRQDRWEQDGAARSKIVVNAANVRLLGAANRGENADSWPANASAGQGTQNHTPAGQAAQGGDGFDDDIPF